MARALNDGIASLKDRDFSVSVTRATRDEMGDLVETYNALGDRLRVERQSLYQRELILDTVIQTTPLALEPHGTGAQRRHRQPQGPRLQRERHARDAGRDGRPRGDLQRARRSPARGASEPLPARADSRHGDPDHAARAGAAWHGRSTTASPASRTATSA